MQKVLNLLTLKNFFIFFLPGTFSLFLVLGSFFYSNKFIFLENLSLDSLQKTFPRNTNENKIFVIDIDEISLEKIGQWPWDRRILAELTKTLKESYNVKVIGFDIDENRLEELKNNPSALHNTNEKKLERKQMLEGKQPSGCQYCWNIECMGKDYVSDRHIKSTSIHQCHV